MKIDKAVWKILLAQKDVKQQDVCDLLRMSRAKFSQRINMSGNFTENEIDQIAKHLNVNATSFVINELGKFENVNPALNQTSSAYSEIDLLRELIKAKDELLKEKDTVIELQRRLSEREKSSDQGEFSAAKSA